MNNLIKIVGFGIIIWVSFGLGILKGKGKVVEKEIVKNVESANIYEEFKLVKMEGIGGNTISTDTFNSVLMISISEGKMYDFIIHLPEDTMKINSWEAIRLVRDL